MRRVGRAAAIGGWLVGILVALALAVTFAPTFFGLETMIVASGSMGRTMPVGSVALTREVDAHAIGVGDVISFRRRGGDGTITHRVVAVEISSGQILFTTKGDANGAPDTEPVVASGRIHRLEYVVPAVGYAVRYARTPFGVLLLVVVPLAGLAIDRRRASAKPRHRAIDADVGWSATTFRLATATPESPKRIAPRKIAPRKIATG